VVGRKAWFDAICADLLPEIMAGTPEAAWASINVLESAWVFAQPRVLELIRKIWLPDARKRMHAWYALRGLQQWDRAALDVAVLIIEQATISNMAVQDLASIVSVSAPDLAPELIGAQLRKQVSEGKKGRKPKPTVSPDASYDEVATVLFSHH